MEIEREIWAFAQALLVHIGEVNPYRFDRRPMDFDDVLDLVAVRYGQDAASRLSAEMEIVWQ